MEALFSSYTNFSITPHHNLCITTPLRESDTFITARLLYRAKFAVHSTDGLFPLILALMHCWCHILIV